MPIHRTLDIISQMLKQKVSSPICPLLKPQKQQVALPHKVREALAEYHRAEAKYGHDSREAQVAHEYFLDISSAENIKPEHYLGHDSHEDEVMDAALNAVNALEELKEIAHVEKKVLDRFGRTDFEIGEGFLEREIGRDDEDTYALWP